MVVTRMQGHLASMEKCVAPTNSVDRVLQYLGLEETLVGEGERAKHLYSIEWLMSLRHDNGRQTHMLCRKLLEEMVHLMGVTW